MVLGSRNIHYVVVKLIILLLLSTTSLKAEDYLWSIEKINEKNVMVSMNGQIQHGDRLYFFIPSANCNRVENLFTFYTAANNSNLTNLKDKPLAIKINDNELYGEVRFMFPMLMGHQVWISIGNYDLDTHIDFLKSYEKLNIEIIDKNSFKSEEYFDIPLNIWSLKGLTEAIEDGKSLCLASLS
ncbi:hypothetical protein N9W05_04610 [Alphaproteobacteria bacterium]|nr:hypothetical protein [Alphaproteobacteria bacterium]